MNVKAEWIRSMQKFFASNRRVSMTTYAGWLKILATTVMLTRFVVVSLEQKANGWSISAGGFFRVRTLIVVGVDFAGNGISGVVVNVGYGAFAVPRPLQRCQWLPIFSFSKHSLYRWIWNLKQTFISTVVQKNKKLRKHLANYLKLGEKNKARD